MLKFLLSIVIIASGLRCGGDIGYRTTQTNSRNLQESLSRGTSLSPIRIEFQIIDPSFTLEGYSLLEQEIIPAIQDFFASLLKIYPLVGPLTPTVDVCNGIKIPEEDSELGFNADVLIYLYSSGNNSFSGQAFHCQQDGGTFKRPLIGAIDINQEDFFSEFLPLQIQFMIHEVSHILAFSQSLFEDFVDSSGKKYLDSEYLSEINYPNRGKTVSAIAFPKMLQKTRDAFDCQVAGLELEDLDDLEQIESHWDLRTMTHDIMSSFMDSETIFSDITLAVFEDSGWYTGDYSYTQNIYWGWHQGCEWFEEKCISDSQAKFPGFCTEVNSETEQCDAFNLGYGGCYRSNSENIPIHEQYFADPTLGGLSYSDYCPIVIASDMNKCRDSLGITAKDAGEAKGINSRCLMSSLSTTASSDSLIFSPSCYKVISCNGISVVLLINNIQVSCPYGLQVPVNTFQGLLNCPASSDFCRPVPCLNMCNGKGQCLSGKCLCNTRYGGEDCSISCMYSCKNCGNAPSKCTSCHENFYLNNQDCFPCSAECKTCEHTSTHCTSCKSGSELVSNTCRDSCSKGCKSCDSPCTQCDSGFYLYGGKCLACDSSCKECGLMATHCTSCNENYRLMINTCMPDCIPHCASCDSPCTLCNAGYYSSGLNCLPCSNLCKTCKGTADFCTSCINKYTLSGNQCKPNCPDFCQSCDSPCTKCEDGYLSINGICQICSNNCLTCTGNAQTCTACNAGFKLSNGTCNKICVEACETCEYPCSQCEAGYFSEFGYCTKCEKNCATCKGSPSSCTTCHPGSGLISHSCVAQCPDHCSTCDSPCSICETGFVLANNICEKCEDSCLTCSGSPDNCDICSYGYKMENNKCVVSCTDNCFTCDEPCSICKNSYYLNNGHCSRCSPLCNTCSVNANTCISCQKGYSLVQNSCKEKCSDHCLNCDSPCTQCEDFFTPVSGTCQPCKFPCKKCDKTTSTCTDCHKGFKLANNACVEECLPQCKTCDNPCSACEIGFIQINGTCSECPVGCATCNQKKDSCLTCMAGYTKQGNTCVEICDKNCKKCEKPCSNCNDGFLLSGGKCFQCDNSCQTCKNYVYECTSCRNTHLLNGKDCEPKCIENCKDCEKPCTECEDGYFPWLGSCSRCPENCATCDNLFTCKSCVADYALQDNDCVSICMPHCTSCDLPCSTCSQGYKLLNSHCTPCASYFNAEEVSAKYSMDLKKIEVHFERSVSLPIDDCSLILKSTNWLGSGYKCIWQSLQMLNVRLGENPGYSITNLELLPIIGQGKTCEFTPDSFILQIATPVLPVPIVSLIIPKQHTINCNTSMLIIEGVTDESNYKFILNSMPPMKFLQDNLNNTSKVIIIPNEKLLQGVINIIFSVTNKYNVHAISNGEISVIPGPSLSISLDSGVSTNIFSDRPFVIKPIIPANSCIAGELKYIWKYHETGYPETEKKFQNSKYLLEINSGFLKAGENYQFKLEVSDGFLHAFAEVAVTVVDKEIIAEIERTSGVANSYEPFTLSGSNSYDPSDPSANLKYHWSCSENNLTCVDSFGQPLIVDPSQEFIYIDTYTIITPASYVFKLIVTSGKKSASDSINITVKDVYGSIKIFPPRSIVNPDVELFIYPYYEIMDIPEFKWTQISGKELKMASDENYSYLHIESGVAKKGESYSFKVSINEELFATVGWKTNVGPSCSDFKLLYTNGDIRTFHIDCTNGDDSEKPLVYSFGIMNQTAFPLKVQYSSTVNLKIPIGSWIIYAQVCDYLSTCERSTLSIEILSRRLEDSQNSYEELMKYPESLPEALLNSVATLDPQQLESVFSDIYSYISGQVLSPEYVAISIECFILISKNFEISPDLQKAMFEFLIDIVDEVDEETMTRILLLLDNLENLNYAEAINLLIKYSEYWIGDSPPNTAKTLLKNTQIIRHRFLGNSTRPYYPMVNVNITQLLFPCYSQEICDVLLIVFPAKPIPIVGVYVFSSGFIENYSTLIEIPTQFEPELPEPILINYETKESEDFICEVSKGTQWITEGCDISQDFSDKLVVKIWHTRLVRITSHGNVETSYLAIFSASAMLVICISMSGFFYFSDRTKRDYIETPKIIEFADINLQSSPRNAEILSLRKEEQKAPEEIMENKGDMAEIRIEIEPNDVSLILIHPYLNIFISQSNNRRSTTVLRLFAVLFTEFIVLGFGLNPYFHQVLDNDLKFVGFSNRQYVIFIIGFLVAQEVSVMLMALNPNGNTSITKRILAFTISLVLIVFCYILVIFMAFSYPKAYSKYWILAFTIVVPIELLVCQNLFWLVAWKLAKRANLANATMASRSVNVRTEG